jgi:predicted DNA-binding transcriptional regulator YafY
MTDRPAPPLVFMYRNWRGETALRRVRPIGISYGTSEWHPEPQWLLHAYDLDKEAERDFSFSNIAAAPASPAAEPTEHNMRLDYRRAVRAEQRAARLEQKLDEARQRNEKLEEAGREVMAWVDALGGFAGENEEPVTCFQNLRAALAQPGGQS